MALLPGKMFRNWWDNIDRRHREMEEHFRKVNACNNDLWRLSSTPFREKLHPWRTESDNLEPDVNVWATIERDENKYQVILDMQQFIPEEITVRIDNKCITVEAKHYEIIDCRSFVSRQLMRCYLVPRGYDIDHVRPKLSSDGILTITAPRLPGPRERIVPIQRTYFPAIKTA